MGRGAKAARTDIFTAESVRPEDRLSMLLLVSLTALAQAGEVEAACRLAGRACMALRAADPAAARRFDVLLHRLAGKLAW